MATMTKIAPPTASNVPKKERRIACFGGLGFGGDVLNNNAANVFIGFMLGESHGCRILADQIRLLFSYLFSLWIIERFRGRVRSDAIAGKELIEAARDR
jgi:hypothetical protein